MKRICYEVSSHAASLILSGAFTSRPGQRVNPLGIRVTADDSGPVVMLSGEADITTVTQLEEALNAQIIAGARILTVDLAGLRFADSAAISTLLRAARALKDRGGRLDLANLQPVLARTLALLGVDKILTVRRGARPGPGDPCSRLAG